MTHFAECSERSNSTHRRPRVRGRARRTGSVFFDDSSGAKSPLHSSAWPSETRTARFGDGSGSHAAMLGARRPPLREHAGGGMLTCRNIPAGGRPFTSASGLSRKNASCLECGSLMLFLRSLGACMRRDFAISDICAGPIRPPRCSRVQRSLSVGAPCLEDSRASAGSRSQLRDFRSDSHLQTRIPCARYRRPRPLAVTVHQPKAAVPNAIR